MSQHSLRPHAVKNIDSLRDRHPRCQHGFRWEIENNTGLKLELRAGTVEATMQLPRNKKCRTQQ